MDKTYQMLMSNNADGYTWAREFNKTAQSLGYAAMDENWLAGWFSNAMGKGRWDQQRDSENLTED